MDEVQKKFIDDLHSLGTLFLKNPTSTKIHIVGHLDTDGICSVALLQKALERKNYSCNVSFYQQLEDASLEELSSFDDEIFFFVDIGANYEFQIKKFLSDKRIIILDHHESSQVQFDFSDDNFIQINPCFYSISQNTSSRGVGVSGVGVSGAGVGVSGAGVSGAGVVYYFSLGLDEKNKDLSYLGVLGALGDGQEREGLQELNKFILEDALHLGILNISKELNLFGTHSRSLVKVLEYSTDMNIPSVTGNFKGVLSFLSDVGIPTYRNGKSRKYIDLVQSEKKILENKLKELKKDSNQTLYKTVYSFADKHSWLIPDLKEFATLINSCGRLRAFDVAIDSVLGNKESLLEAKKLLNNYKAKLRDSFSLFKKRKELGQIYDENNLVIVHFKNELDFSIAGVVASMIARNNVYSPGKIICVACENNDQTKVSLRISQDKKGVNLRVLLVGIAQKLGFSSGGHENAAGMIFSSEKLGDFLDLLKNSC